MRKTKIICTIGPASEPEDVLSKMMDAGMNVARLNMSHGDYNEHGKRIERIHRLRAQKKIPLAIMLDTKGPEVRTRTFVDDKPVTLVEGQRFTLTSRDVPGTEKIVSVTYPKLCELVTAGTRILIDDGLVSMVVDRVDKGTDVQCTVQDGGTIGNHKGISVPSVDLQMPSLTEQDKKDVLFGIEQGVELIAASFVCRATDVLALRKLLEENGGHGIQIFAKIENRTGVENFEEILGAADGIMVARGDLGVEVNMEEVPVLQKRFIRKCNAMGKPVITATQMLDSMMRNARPTRAEVNDVANAILDGTDSIMLSGETASGKYPVESLRAMDRIAAYVEQHTKRRLAEIHESLDGGQSLTNAVSFACYSMAADLNAAAIITPSRSGHTARNVAKYRPDCLLIATTDNDRAYHQLSTVWGVLPVRMESVTTTDEMMQESVDVAGQAGLIKDGDIAIISAGVPVGVPGTTNLIKVHVVGDVLLTGRGIGGGNAGGRVCVVKDVHDAQSRFQAGDVLVTAMTDNSMLPLMKKAAAIIVESDDLMCHAALVGFALEIPVLLDVGRQATSKLKDGMRISVDANAGYVYNGDAHHRKPQ